MGHASLKAGDRLALVRLSVEMGYWGQESDEFGAASVLETTDEMDATDKTKAHQRLHMALSLLEQDGSDGGDLLDLLDQIETFAAAGQADEWAAVKCLLIIAIQGTPVELSYGAENGEARDDEDT